MIVQQCEKKTNKVVHKSKHHALKTKETKEDKLLLSDLLGLKDKKPSGKLEQQDKRPSSDIWNYIDE